MCAMKCSGATMVASSVNLRKVVGEEWWDSTRAYKTASRARVISFWKVGRWASQTVERTSKTLSSSDVPTGPLSRP